MCRPVGSKPPGEPRSAFRTPAVRRVSGSTAGGRTPDWWMSTQATTQRCHRWVATASMQLCTCESAEWLCACLPVFIHAAHVVGDARRTSK